MATLGIEQPPQDTDRDLTDYLVRQWRKVDSALGEDNYFPPRTTMPARARIGETYYFASAIPTTVITGEGLWIYKSTGWTQII